MLDVRNVSKGYDSRRQKARRPERLEVLRDVSFGLNEGDFLTVIGPSGCGKTTLLRIISGLETYDSGQVRVDAKVVDGPYPECAVVFQHASLLPWRNVLRNVEYGLELRRSTSRSHRRERALDALRMVGLSEFSTHYPHQLSGGMQQRVNLARALAVEPTILLMDEPFGALDSMTKENLQDQLSRLSSVTKKTTVFITHDVEEAAFLGDQVLVMDSSPGRVLDIVRVELTRPRSRDVVTSEEFQATVQKLRATLQAARPSLMSTENRAGP